MKTGWGGNAVVLAVLLTAALGFCVLDRHADGTGDHAMAPDLCLGMVAVSLGVVLLARLRASGRAYPDVVRSVSTLSIHVLDPPPKAASLA